MLCSQKAIRTAPETAVTAIILTRLCAAIDCIEDPCAGVRFDFAFLHFDFCDARIKDLVGLRAKIPSLLGS